MHRDRQHHRLQASALTGMTLTLTHETLDIFTHELTVSLFMAAFEIRNHAFVGAQSITNSFIAANGFGVPGISQVSGSISISATLADHE